MFIKVLSLLSSASHLWNGGGKWSALRNSTTFRKKTKSDLFLVLKVYVYFKDILAGYLSQSYVAVLSRNIYILRQSI